MIREGAFFGCSNLYHITLPEGLTTINEYTFCGCCSLSHVTFPESLKTIEMGAFIDCTNLRYIIIDTDNKEHYDAVKEMYNRPFMFYKEGDILPFELCQAIQQTRKQYRLKMQTAILNQQPHLLTALNTIVASYMIDKPTKVAAIGFFKDALPLPANIIKLVQAYSDLPLLFDSKQTIEDVAPPSCMAEIETYRQNLQKCIDALLPAAIINIEEECREERQENEEEKAMPRGAFFKEPLGDEAPKDNRSGAYKQSSCCIS